MATGADGESMGARIGAVFGVAVPVTGAVGFPQAVLWRHGTNPGCSGDA